MNGALQAILAYLVVVAVGAWAVAAVEKPGSSGELAPGPLVVGAAILMIPAMILTTWLVERFEAGSEVPRAVIGAAAWAGWSVFVAISAAVAGGIVILAQPLADAIVASAVAGAGFALLGLDGSVMRPGKLLVLLAFVVAATIVLGLVVLRGQWGAAA